MTVRRLGNSYSLSLQITDRVHAVSPEQLEAPDVASRENDNLISCCYPEDVRRGEVHRDVDLASHQGRLDLLGPCFGTYWISVKPSLRSSSSATYCGATQTHLAGDPA